MSASNRHSEIEGGSPCTPGRQALQLDLRTNQSLQHTPLIELHEADEPLAGEKERMCICFNVLEPEAQLIRVCSLQAQSLRFERRSPGISQQAEVFTLKSDVPTQLPYMSE